MKEYFKIILSALIGSIIPAICFIWFLSSTLSKYELEIKNTKQEIVELKQEIKELKEISYISQRTTSLENQVTKQWNFIGDIKSTLDKREAIIENGQEDIKELQSRMRKVESQTEWIRNISQKFSQ